MLSYLSYLVVDSCIDLFFGKFDEILAHPEYRKVMLSSLVGRSVPCLWARHTLGRGGWAMYYNVRFEKGGNYCGKVMYDITADGCKYDIPVKLKRGGVLRGGVLTSRFDMLVYVSDTISYLPPWGMYLA